MAHAYRELSATPSDFSSFTPSGSTRPSMAGDGTAWIAEDSQSDASVLMHSSVDVSLASVSDFNCSTEDDDEEEDDDRQDREHESSREESREQDESEQDESQQEDSEMSEPQETVERDQTPSPEPTATVIHIPTAMLATATTPAPAPAPLPTAHLSFFTDEELDVEALLVMGDISAIRVHFTRLQRELASAQAAKKQLANRAEELEQELKEARLQAQQDAARALDAERAASDSANEAAAATLKFAAMEAENEVAAAASLASPSRRYQVSADKPAAALTALRETAAARSAAHRARLKKSTYDPVRATSKLAKSCASDIREQLNSFSQEMHETFKLVVGAVITHCAQSDASSLMQRYKSERKQRQRLHDQLLELQGNIRVFARVRPLMSNSATNASGGEAAVAALTGSLQSSPNDAGRLVQELEQDATRFIDEHTLALSGRVFDFDRVMHQQTTQEEVYSNVAPYIQSVLDGLSIVIFAYGQTGSGKTWTMDGQEGNEGVNVRALRHLFELLGQRSADEWESKVTLSSVELYNEQPRDLLLPPGAYKKTLGNEPSKLEIHQTAEGQIHIPGLTEHTVRSSADVIAFMNSHIKPNRSTAATHMNEYSSRSHSLIFITVESRNLENEAERSCGRLVLIDLAGSERVKKSAAEGQSLKEATHINKSLLALGDVMTALKTKAAHVPYRNSKLTYLLSDKLAGNNKCIMLAQISPSVSDAQESSCTLQFASRVRAVQLGPTKTKRGQASLTKLIKAETQLSEKDSQLASVMAEMRGLREELQNERSSSLVKLTTAQTSVAERVRALELELSKKASAADEVQHLAGLIRAKDRELIELKARNRASAAPVTLAPAAVIRSTLPIPSPSASPFAHAFTADLSSPTQQQAGVNLIELECSVPDAIPLASFDDVELTEDLRVEDVDENGDDAADKENAPVTKRLSGTKRKESPEKTNSQENDEPLAEATSWKKQKAMPLTPAKNFLGSSSLLNTSSVPILGGLTKVAAAGLPVKASSFKASKDLRTPRPAVKSIVAAAWKQGPLVDTSLAALDDSCMDFTSDAVVSTPVSAKRSVHFGACETKFISPSPVHHSSSAAASAASIITAPASLEALRVRAKRTGSAITRTSSLLGGAKRQAVKSTWNSNFK